MGAIVHRSLALWYWRMDWYVCFWLVIVIYRLGINFIDTVCKYHYTWLIFIIGAVLKEDQAKLFFKINLFKKINVLKKFIHYDWNLNQAIGLLYVTLCYLVIYIRTPGLHVSATYAFVFRLICFLYLQSICICFFWIYMSTLH